MNRIIIYFVMLLTALSASAKFDTVAEDTAIDGYITTLYYDSSEGNYAVITNLTATKLREIRMSKRISFPESLSYEGKEYKVKTVCVQFADKAVTETEEIELPHNLRIINSNTFKNLPNIRLITGGEKLSSIGPNNFSNMPLLKTIELNTEAIYHGSFCELGIERLILPPECKRTWSGRCYAYGVTCSYLPNLVELDLGGIEIIEEMSFIELPLLKTLTIPATCVSIEAALAFMESLEELHYAPRNGEPLTLHRETYNKCPKLKDVYVEDVTPFKVSFEGYQCFVSGYEPLDLSLCTLHVPVGSKEAYAAEYYWKDFGTIVEDVAGIETPIADIEAPVDAEYFTLQGVKVENPGKGIFLRRTGSEVVKIAIP